MLLSLLLFVVKILLIVVKLRTYWEVKSCYEYEIWHTVHGLKEVAKPNFSSAFFNLIKIQFQNEIRCKFYTFMNVNVTKSKIKTCQTKTQIKYTFCLGVPQRICSISSVCRLAIAFFSSLPFFKNKILCMLNISYNIFL